MWEWRCRNFPGTNLQIFSARTDTAGDFCFAGKMGDDHREVSLDAASWLQTESSIIQDAHDLSAVFLTAEFTGDGFPHAVMWAEQGDKGGRPVSFCKILLRHGAYAGLDTMHIVFN